jgi:HD-GYP domain-containing protein (c-di-GMP phosphodiesterase class II)
MPSPGAFALLAAAFLLAELLQRADDELLPEPLEAERFSLSAPVHVASILVLGPLPAAALGFVGTCLVRPFKGERLVTTFGRALGIAVAALAAGYAAQLAGLTAGELQLSEDMLGVAALGVVYGAIRSVAVTFVVGRVLPQPDVLTVASEVGLGMALAYAALQDLWLAVALVPVLLLLDQIYGRLVQLRRETATALETFANIVDERDPSTYGHSVRVAEYVRELAGGLGLPRLEVSRLWWAGRLHDLGKVAVDASVLRKPGKLTPAEWGVVWRAPRLSARLLQRFRFAAQQAQAVEYHRERYDGSGYYGLRSDDTPLAAHFLIVADAFDAMTTDRPFREALTEEEALAELERKSGTQFHPMVAKAFVAIRRGQSPSSVLDREELRMLHEAPVPYRVALGGHGQLRHRPELVSVIGGAVVLVGLGTEIVELVAAGGAVAFTGLVVTARKRFRSRRLARRLHRALDGATDRENLFEAFDELVARTWKTSYAALVAWDEDGSGGTVVRSRGDREVAEPVLVSWLLREAESGLDFAVDLGQLGAGTTSLALPLRRANGALFGFIVLRSRKQPPTHLLDALTRSTGDVNEAFADTRAPVPFRPGSAVSAASDPDGREQARALQA